MRTGMHMRLKILHVALLCMAMTYANSAHAGIVRYRVDVVVTKAFAGVPLDTTGTVTVTYDDALPDQNTSGPGHQNRGWYGYPDLPAASILWEYGGTNAVYTEQGHISVGYGGNLLSEDIYAFGGGATQLDAEGITKGAFQNFVYIGGGAVRFRDFQKSLFTSDALVVPDFSKVDVASGDVSFLGNSAFVGHSITAMTVLDTNTDTNALFTAGSPASLNQPIATPATQFAINFDVSFDAAAVTGGATLRVSLDGMLLDTIIANTASVVAPTTIQVIDTALRDLTAANLEFLFDGPTGSTMTLDNIVIPGSDLLNGDFEVQSLAAWGRTGPGTITAQVLPNSVPEPASLVVVAVGALVFFNRRRRAR